MRRFGKKDLGEGDFLQEVPLSKPLRQELFQRGHGGGKYGSTPYSPPPCALQRSALWGIGEMNGVCPPTKVLVKLFQKLAVSKGGALVALRRARNATKTAFSLLRLFGQREKMRRFGKKDLGERGLLTRSPPLQTSPPRTFSKRTRRR